MSEYDELAVEYAEQFGEAVPLYGIAYETDAELLDIIRRAIEEKKPIVPEYSDDQNVVY